MTIKSRFKSWFGPIRLKRHTDTRRAKKRVEREATTSFITGDEQIAMAKLGKKDYLGYLRISQSPHLNPGEKHLAIISLLKKDPNQGKNNAKSVQIEKIIGKHQKMFTDWKEGNPDTPTLRRNPSQY